MFRKAILESVDEYRDRLLPMMDKMQEEGVWRLLKRTVEPKYFFDMEGIVSVFRVEPVQPQE